jgi:hypothetical protein
LVHTLTNDVLGSYDGQIYNVARVESKGNACRIFVGFHTGKCHLEEEEEEGDGFRAISFYDGRWSWPVLCFRVSGSGSLRL